VLKNPRDEAARTKVRAALQRIRTERRDFSPGDAPAIARVVEGAEMESPGGFPTASFVVGLSPGFKTGSALSGAVVRPSTSPGGTHGYLPGPRDMESSFFIVGEGVPAGRSLGPIDMRDVAPTLAAKLGLALPRAEGRNKL
jgi:hypothetical protein